MGAAPRDAAACDAAACDAAACEDAAARDAAACDAAACDDAAARDAAPNDECTIDDCYASAGYVLASGFSPLRHEACGTSCKAGSSRGQAYSKEEASEERLLPLSVDEDVERTPPEVLPIMCAR